MNKLSSNFNRYMVILGAIIVVCVVLYFSFTTVDGVALGNQKGKATVVNKEYRETKRGYSTEIIGGRTKAVPRVTPEMYILKLKLDGKETEFAVEKELYSAVNVGDYVQIIYQRRRITGAIKIIEVTR
ncbi:MAG TPA: hypothetical protein VFV58_24970 [Blastocatellia bacterium]|jgi:hypothetical protein|nr:hypothetical protein [Blastocatellia bacterium]